MNVIIFLIVFSYIANWGRVKLLIQGIGKEKKVFLPFKNKSFLDKVNKKVRVNFQIKVQNSPLIYGYSPSVPLKPLFVVSSGAIRYLKENELEWLVLHEMGHCIMWHLVKEVFVYMILLLLGSFAVYFLHINLYFVLSLSLILGLLWYQIERIFEYQADTFSLERIDDPQGMIEANKKMKARVRSIFYKNVLLTFLFTPHLTYDQRIAMATDKLVPK